MHEETRQRVRALLLVPEPVLLLHAGAGARLELPGDVRRLGGRRPLLVPADRLLLQEAVGRRRRQEGVHRQPHRRLRVHPRHAADGRHRFGTLDFQRRSPRKVAAMPAETDLRHAVADHAAAVHRRDRQVGADSAVRLAAGRDGRPDAGVGPDPCGDDGHRGRLHDRAQRRAVRACADDAGRSSRSSARRRRSSPARSAWCRTTSSACWRIRRCRSSATCSWRWASARTAPASSTSTPTRSSRPAVPRLGRGDPRARFEGRPDPQRRAGGLARDLRGDAGAVGRLRSVAAAEPFQFVERHAVDPRIRHRVLRRHRRPQPDAARADRVPDADRAACRGGRASRRRSRNSRSSCCCSRRR